MDQCTHEVRAQHWRKVLHSCQQRPAGQSAKNWLEENDICEQSYYYWQRRLREKTYQQMPKDTSSVPATENNTGVSFAEIPWQQATLEHMDMMSSFAPAAVLKTATMTIAITNEISDSLLSRIIQEVSHA